MRCRVVFALCVLETIFWLSSAGSGGNDLSSRVDTLGVARTRSDDTSNDAVAMDCVEDESETKSWGSSLSHLAKKALGRVAGAPSPVPCLEKRPTLWATVANHFTFVTRHAAPPQRPRKGWDDPWLQEKGLLVGSSWLPAIILLLGFLYVAARWLFERPKIRRVTDRVPKWKRVSQRATAGKLICGMGDASRSADPRDLSGSGGAILGDGVGRQHRCPHGDRAVRAQDAAGN